MPVHLTCSVCWTVFTVKANRTSTARFCSKACRGVAKIATRPTAICRGCQKPFSYTPSEPRMFCAQACRFASTARENRSCESCGRAFIFRLSLRTKSGSGRFCSVPCKNAGISTARDLRFWSKVNKTGTCWLWTAGTDDDGYGAFDASRAHRIAWELASGQPIPEGLLACHTCDIRACVRNDDVGIYRIGSKECIRRGHLFLGTPADNMADMSLKMKH